MRDAPRRTGGRQRRHRAWRITDLASSGPAAPDIPSTTVSSPLPVLLLLPPSHPHPTPSLPLRSIPFRRASRDVDRPGTARPHAPRRLDCSFRIRLRFYLLFAGALPHCMIAFRVRGVSLRAKRGTAAGGRAGSAQERRKHGVFSFSNERRGPCTLSDNWRLGGGACRRNTEVSTGEKRLSLFPLLPLLLLLFFA